MPRARTFKYWFCALLALGASAPAWTQPMIGQMIEQTKKSKLTELFPAPLQSPPGGPLAKRSTELAEPAEPALWSLTGINDALVAEVLLGEQVHRIPVSRGVTLPQGWTVMAANANSLTLQNKKRTLTLFAPAPGSMGAEFPSLKKTRSTYVDPLAALEAQLNSRGMPLEITKAEAPAPSASSSVGAARQAAGSLPRKP